jgi:hypothetical protein
LRIAATLLCHDRQMVKRPLPTKAERVYRRELKKLARLRLHDLGVALHALCQVDTRALPVHALDTSIATLEALARKIKTGPRW